jgi:hypothetical protein
VRQVAPCAACALLTDPRGYQRPRPSSEVTTCGLCVPCVQRPGLRAEPLDLALEMVGARGGGRNRSSSAGLGDARSAGSREIGAAHLLPVGPRWAAHSPIAVRFTWLSLMTRERDRRERLFVAAKQSGYAVFISPLTRGARRTMFWTRRRVLWPAAD